MVPRQVEDTEPGRRRNDGGVVRKGYGGRIGVRDKGGLLQGLDPWMRRRSALPPGQSCRPGAP